VNGSNSQVNLVGNAATVTVTRETSGHISFNDITAMEAALFSDFVDDAIWLINNSTSPELYGLSFPNRTATTQFPAFTAGTFGNLLGPKPVGELLGKPVYRLENVPALGNKGDIILYSPKAIAAGQSGLIGDQTPYLYFDKAVNTYRFLWYADTVNPMTVPYTRKDGSQASNIVVLSGTSG
jgi:HK97 family phage major capsid protein